VERTAQIKALTRKDEKLRHTGLPVQGLQTTFDPSRFLSVKALTFRQLGAQGRQFLVTLFQRVAESMILFLKLFFTD